jgi:hypothetical protein
MKPVCIDYETYYDKQGCSVVDLGEHNYCRHPKFDAYLVSVVGEDLDFVGHPKDFNWDSIRGREIVAHNARFDQAVAEACAEKGVMPDHIAKARWHDSADLSAYLLVGRSLADASANLYPQQAVDKGLRNWMVGKTWDDAVAAGKAEALRAYAMKDAWTSWNIWQDNHEAWLPTEQALSEHTREMSRMGIRIDRPMCEQIISEMEEAEFDALKLLPWVQRDGEKAMSIPALKAECRRMNVPPPESTDDKSDEFHAWLEQHGAKVPFVRAFKDLKKINTHKSRIETMLRCARSTDDRWSYGLRYYGALPTGRWAAGSGGGETSTGNVQNQNRDLALGKYDLRHLLIPAPGHRFIIADYSSIEPVVTAWYTGDHALLNAVRAGEDIYEAYARSRGLYSGTEPLKAHKELRGRVKGAVLSCCYCVGAARLAAQYGMPENEAAKVVADYRQMNPAVTGMWRKLEGLMAQAVMERNSEDRQVEIELPSRRVLRYLDLQRRAGQYLGRKSRGAKDLHTNLYGGRLFNALIQGTARDVLGEAILRLWRAGFRVVMHVHDEVVVEVPEQDAIAAQQEIERLMTAPMPWAPTMPLRTESHITNHYQK